MNRYMTVEEGKQKARELLAEAKKEVRAHFMEWKEKTPAYIQAYEKLNTAHRMCNAYGVRY